MTEPDRPPAPWDAEQLWLKAKLFINRALADPDERPVDERTLWALLSLELLGKAALAKAHPVLIATPNEEANHMLAALGLNDDRAGFKTIQASTVYKRCAKAFKPFDERTAISVTERRNAYLHSGEPTVIGEIPEDAWWPKFWALAEVLVHACDRDLEAFVGPLHLASVQDALARNHDIIANRAEMLLERARQLLNRFETGAMTQRELASWNRVDDLTAGLRYATPTTCPACGNDTGMLEGDEVLSSETSYERYSDEDWGMIVDVEVAPEYFSCATCHCVLDGYEILQAVNLPETFTTEGDPDDFIDYDEYGND